MESPHKPRKPIVCVCVLGFEGERCQSLVDHCVSGPCRNGATCSSSLDGPHCYCAEGTY